MQWNSRSLRRKVPELCFLIRKHSPVLVAVSETWFVPGTRYRVPGFSCLRDDRQDGMAGCALFVSLSQIFYQITLPTHSPEINAVAVRAFNISFISMYIPQPSPYLISDILLIISSVPPPVIIMGDFNAHHTSWGSYHCDTFGRLLFEMFEEANLCLCNDGSPTRRVLPSQNPKSAVDLTLCSPSLLLSLSWQVLPLSRGSDHFPILSNLAFTVSQPPPPTPLLKYRVSGAKWDVYSSSLENKIISIPDSCDENPLVCYSKLVEAILSAADESIPLKKHKHNFYSPPWWDSECTQVVRERNIAEINYNRCMSFDNYLAFQRASAKYRKILSSKKKQGWIKFCESLSPTTPSALVWKQIRRFRGAYNFINPTSNDPFSWIEAFANKLSPPYVQQNPSTNYPNSSLSSSHFDPPFTFDELQMALDGLVDSTPGVDGIPYSFITRANENFKRYFLNLVNIFFEQGFIPDSWKTQIIVPILKPGKDPSNPNSHRPIALSCVTAKISEILIKNRLEWFVENNNSLAKSQFGFRKGMSTSDSLSILTTDIRVAAKNKEYLVAVFLDVASAYDNVLLPILRNKLLELSISAKMVKFISCFLMERTIIVKHQGSNATTRTVWKGLPQGSVLSPPLYSLYTVDLEHSVSPFCQVLQYADDLALYVSSKSIQEAESSLNSALSYLEDWLNEHGLSISASKSSAIVFTRKRTIPDVNLRCNSEVIPQKNIAKFLGMWLDTRLTGVPHSEYISSKCEKNINILRSLSGVWWGSHPFSQKLLYNSIIRSHFDYGTFLLEPGNKPALNKLSVIQSKCLRIILGAMKTSPTNALQVECGDPPLQLRRQFLADRFLFKLAQNSDHPLWPKLEKLYSLITPNEIRFQINLPCLIRSYIKLLRLPFTIVKFPNNPLFSIQYEALTYQPTIILNLGIDKETIDPAKIFSEIICTKWKDWLTIFTDASKLNQDSPVGAAVWIPKYRIILSNSCPPLTSVFTGEAIAILEAIRYVNSHLIEKAFILSDSKSCLQSIMANQLKAKNKFPVILKIKEELLKCHSLGLQVVLAWIPGHAGIPGNENADVCAKRAVTSGNKDYFHVYSHDLTSTCQPQLHASWNAHWQRSKTIKGKFYGQIQQTIPAKPWFFKFKKLNKQTTSTICRLRLGFACTPVFLSKIRVRDHSLCECGLDEGTTDHIFFDCTRCRFSLYDMIPDDLPRPTNFSNLLPLVFSPFVYILSKYIKINNIKL